MKVLLGRSSNRRQLKSISDCIDLQCSNLSELSQLTVSTRQNCLVLGAIPIQTYMRQAFLTNDENCGNLTETCASKLCTSDNCDESTVELFQNEVFDAQANVTQLKYSTFMKFE